jgi:hypothetical protein
MSNYSVAAISIGECKMSVAAAVLKNGRDCLIEANSTTMCSNCGKGVSSTSVEGNEQVLCNYLNEGGLQRELNIYPVLQEEAYLKLNPQERKPRAFMEFCRDIDFMAIVDMLHDEDGEGVGEGHPSMAAILRYQDPTASMRSALHVAVATSHEGMVWLILIIASRLPLELIPPEAHELANHYGITRQDQTSLVDIRTLKDSQDLTAAQYADSDFASHFDLKLLQPELD